MNLNNILVKDGCEMKSQNNFSNKGINNDIEVYFKNIESIIIEKIKKYNNVIGCVAWLTNKNILKELSKKKECIIIIQDEDFLRPDNNFDGDNSKWKKKIFKSYKKLEKNDITFLNLGLDINTNGFTQTGIRRCGNINNRKLPAFPRMHNKFII